MFNINGQEYLTTAEAAEQIGYSVQAFHNRRSREGDRFLRGHELIPGRLFYRQPEVLLAASERVR
jgi:hypothetical protein